MPRARHVVVVIRVLLYKDRHAASFAVATAVALQWGES